MSTVSEPTYVRTTWHCLSELEIEYLRVGQDHCNALQDRTQLSAFLLLGIRNVSLLRAMFRLLEPDFLDSYDAVRRAFVESWALQYEFRLKQSTNKAQKWLQQDAQSWKADAKSLKESNTQLGLGSPDFARELGDLSEVAHPTFVAASNSVSIASVLRGLSPNKERLEKSYKDLCIDYLGLVNRQIWVTLITAEHLISLPISTERLSLSVDFHRSHIPL